MNLLVVEDEPRMLELLRDGLSDEGHAVSCTTDGIRGLEMLRGGQFDAVILDVMLPSIDGFEITRRLRNERDRTPIIMLTAKDSVPDVVHGLDLGADDYVTKPFSFNELLLRLQAVNRNAHTPRSAYLNVGDLSLDLTTRDAYRRGRRISLTRTEYCLLERLMRDAGEVISRNSLIASVGRHIGGNTLEAFMRLLRNKIDPDEESKLIRTIRGVGYMITPDNQA
jgi:DNA-binding response OmpR family regulator